ncbi:hypothetical protein Ocin01_07985 [Orchesella cincta]|uniref:Chitin-binding type-2 domain-containing protein n=1 Tax=Orchesella cincta TaxID=48709 RepID=A0A1D2N072_ORCCI|nr:hypothetical protein Ocin01_07985 [Orchesella cincta]
MRAVDPVDFLESLKDDDDLSSPQNDRESSSTEYPNGVNVIPGEAEVNYPIYSTIPKSSFSCIGRPVGFYADTELRCQVWHICDEESRQQSFLCTNGTVYSQDKRVCDWWYNVNCDHEEVSRNYLQNYDLYKGPPPKSENQEQNENNNNDNKNENNDYKPQTKAPKDPFYNRDRLPSLNNDTTATMMTNNSQGLLHLPTMNPHGRLLPALIITIIRLPQQQEDSHLQQLVHLQLLHHTELPRPPAALENNPFTNRPQRPTPSEPQDQERVITTTSPNNNNNNVRTKLKSDSKTTSIQLLGSTQQRSSDKYYQAPTKRQNPGQPQKTQPSIQTKKENGKRIVEIRVPLSQIPPEILAKYGKRIPEHILKEIFVNFTRGQQQQLQQEAINNRPGNPTGAASTRSPPPNVPIARSQPPSSPKKPVDFGGPQKSSSFSGNPNPSSAPKQSFPGNSNPSSSVPKQSFSDNDSPPPSKSSYSGNSNPPRTTTPPPHQEHHLKFRHSTPRKTDNVKFATATRELLAEYDEERQLVGESQNPIYSLQQLFSGHHSRTSKSKPSYDSAGLKEAFTFATTTTTSTTPYPPQQQYEDFTRRPQQKQPQPYQEFTRQPRRRTQATTTTSTTTTEEPQLITDRYVPVKSQEEKRMAEIRRIFLVAKQGIKVLPPVPVLSKNQEPSIRREVTQRPPVRTTTERFDFPPVPKVAIPDDYYVKSERFEEAESRYPRPSVPASYVEPQARRQPPRPTTTTTTSTTTTSTTTTTPAPTYQEPDFHRTKPSKPQNRKKALPPPEEKKQESTDYDDSARERPNTDELELLRLAQEYIELTGQDFGVRQRPKSA